MAGPALHRGEDEEKFVAEIRANIAFEKMVLAALATALGCGAVALLASAVSVFRGGGLFALADAAIDGFAVAAFVFLGGFGGAAVVGVPLFRKLKEEKRRLRAPWLIASLAVNLLALTVAGRFPTFDAPMRFLLLAPGFIMPLVFMRLMAPLWRGRDGEPASGSGTVVDIRRFDA